MRSRPSAALCLALLLCACGTQSGNPATNGAEPDAAAPPPAPGTNGAGPAGRPGETAPPPPPESGGQAPEPSGEVTLSAAPARVSEGATVTLTLRNGTSGQVGYNLCTSALETSAGRPVPTSRVCTMELRTLEPGRAATYRYELPVNMVAGSYRFLTQVHAMGSDRTSGLRSNSVEVTAD